MSHITRAATSITVPVPELMDEAIRQVAREENLIESYVNSDAKGQYWTCGNVSFEVRDHRLIALYDKMGNGKKVADRVVQVYTAKAFSRALGKLGYRQQSTTFDQKIGIKAFGP